MTETPGLQVISSLLQTSCGGLTDLREDTVSVSSCLLSALPARELRLCVGLSRGEKSFVVLKLALVEWGM